MESFEFAQWGAIAFLVWRVFALEASQLTKDDFKPIHSALDEVIRRQKETKDRGGKSLGIWDPGDPSE